jgi:amidase
MSGGVEAQTTAARGADEELAWAGPAAQAEAVRDGSVSPTELVEMHLARIARLDPQLNGFRVVLAERALAEAKQAEARLKAGEERPLLGVPIALKDTADLAGEQTCHGTDGFPEPVRDDSVMVSRLRAAGAIIIGKTHLPEMAIHGFTESATWGVTRNPWDTQRSPGGSSGGSAAAVAAGLVSAASGSDGAGSIRIPAASCGLFGLKPTRGRIPVNLDWESWHGLSVNGFLTRGVADSAMLLDITAGGSTEPGAVADAELAFADAVNTRPQGLRIATTVKPLPLLDTAPIIDDAVPAAIAETGRLLESLGHGVTEDAPQWGALVPNFLTRYLRGIRDEVRNVPRPERLERRTRGFARLAAGLTDGLLRRAREGEEADRRRILPFFEKHDVLMMPVMGTTAVPVRRWEGHGAFWTLNGMARIYCWTGPFNHLGFPAASVPAGFAPDGLPLAVQLVAPPGREDLLLSLAAQLEEARPWADRRPPVS